MKPTPGGYPMNWGSLAAGLLMNDEVRGAITKAARWAYN